MSMEIRDDTIGIWFLPGGNKDLMVCMNPVEGVPGRLELVYRFRYYDPNDPGNNPMSGKDRKSWGSRETDVPVEQAVKSVRELLNYMKLAGFSNMDYDELLNTEQDAKKFMEAFGKKPYVHTTVVGPEGVTGSDASSPLKV